VVQPDTCKELPQPAASAVAAMTVSQRDIYQPHKHQQVHNSK